LIFFSNIVNIKLPYFKAKRYLIRRNDMANVLLIDDSQLARGLMRGIMENTGYTVCGEAANGQEGLEKFKQMRPDLVFCDIMMHGMNGVECMREILKEDPNAKVVICTSVGDKLHTEEAITAGAKGFIVKPIKASEVIRITETLIGKPAPVPKKSYKEIMSERAASEGIEGKPLLDFFEAFQKFNGFGFDDPKINEQYLRENGAGMIIGVRALLSAKMSKAQVDQVMNIFEGLVS